MRRLLKRVASFFLVPLTRWYLRKDRPFRFRGIRIIVKSGVFHPGLFSSTRFILEYLGNRDLAGRSFLELGCGTGLISIVAAKEGADVSSSDLSVSALRNAKENAIQNQVSITFFHSDLFDAIPKKEYDWIVINPPFYAKDPVSEEDLAWYCGMDFAYYKKLFTTLSGYLHPTTNVLMVLTKGCDVDRIMEIAGQHKFGFHKVAEKNVLFDEKNYLFLIQAVV